MSFCTMCFQAQRSTATNGLSYRGLSALNYTHHTVNHSRNFIDPVVGIVHRMSTQWLMTMNISINTVFYFQEHTPMQLRASGDRQSIT